MMTLYGLKKKEIDNPGPEMESKMEYTGIIATTVPDREGDIFSEKVFHILRMVRFLAHLAIGRYFLRCV